MKLNFILIILLIIFIGGCDKKSNESDGNDENHEDNIQTITDMFKGKKYNNGKKAIAKKDKVLIKIGTGDPKPGGRTAGKKILTKDGEFVPVDLKDYNV